MRRSLVALVLVLTGCQGKEGKPIDNSTTGGSGATAAPPKPALGSGTDFDVALVDLESYRDRMCKCEDVPCTETVFKEFQTWRQDFRKGNTSRPKPTPEQDKKGNDINRAMMACKTNVTSKAGKGSGSAGSAAASKDPVETALGELDAFKIRMCACTDKACGDKLQTEYAEWQRNLRTKMIEKPNKLQEVRGNALEKEMKECRKKAETATPGAAGGTSKVDNFLTQMQGYRDKICACTAKDCAAKLQKELETWLTTAAKDIADAKPTKDQDDKADRLEAEMKSCVTKLK
jgi:hypothetical protein